MWWCEGHECRHLAGAVPVSSKATDFRLTLERAALVQSQLRAAVAVPTTVHRGAATRPLRTRGEIQHGLARRRNGDRAFVRFGSAGVHRAVPLCVGAKGLLADRVGDDGVRGPLPDVAAVDKSRGKHVVPAPCG